MTGWEVLVHSCCCLYFQSLYRGKEVHLRPLGSARATRQGAFSTHCYSFHLHNYPVKSVLLLKPLLQMEELKLRVVKRAVPNHKASKKQIQNLNLSLSGSKAYVLSSSQVASYVLGEKGK